MYTPFLGCMSLRNRDKEKANKERESNRCDK